MRPEISNELLLQVIQAWDPDEADKWSVDKDKDLMWGDYFIRGEDHIFSHDERRAWHEASELVEFLLKDRPDLGLIDGPAWKEEVPVYKCEKATGASWNSDPWNNGYMEPERIVARIKAYEYLKEWKETQEHLQLQDRLVECGKPECRKPEESDGEFRRRLLGPIPPPSPRLVSLLREAKIPATYEAICPHCNGSKEVTGWYGKESCQACG